ncbi:MAG: heme-binding protein [Lawsonibacter sp.]
MIHRVSQAQFSALCSYVTDKIEKEHGKPIVISIADEAGDIIHMTHMDGTPSRSGIIASGKAYTAAKMNRSTTALRQFCEESKTPISDFVIQGMTTMPGGTPVLDKKGELAGAVGVSGRSAAEDQEMADLCAAFLSDLC